MTIYLLDTNHLSPLVTLHHPLRLKILTNLQMGHTFAIPSPALGEFIFGIGVLPRAKQNLQIWEQLRDSFIYYGLDEADAEQASKLRIDLRKRGKQLGIIDSFISVIALRYQLTLLTTDKDFAAVPSLRQMNWRDD